MSSLWLNWRFGTRHLQVGKDGISFHINPYYITNPPAKWFQRY